MTAHRLLEPTAQLTAAPQHADIVHVSGGTFRMGSDRHYREEAPAHRVTVDGFWIDRTPVTNAQFRRFVEETDTLPSPSFRPSLRIIPARCRTC